MLHWEVEEVLEALEALGNSVDCTEISCKFAADLLEKCHSATQRHFHQYLYPDSHFVGRQLFERRLECRGGASCEQQPGDNIIIHKNFKL